MELKYKVPDILVPFNEPLIRLGNKHDGGYLISPIGITTNNLLTFGVGNDWGFELDWIKYNNCGIIHSYDGTVDVKRFSRNKLKTFYNLYRKHNFLQFYRKNRKFYNKNVTIDNIEFIFNNIGNKNTFFKCDIEDAEYDILGNIIKNDRIDQLVMEFHWLVTDKNLEQFINFIEKMSNKYNLIHIHANNYSYNPNHYFADVVEITMLKKELCVSNTKRKTIYHELDSECNPDGAEIVLY